MKGLRLNFQGETRVFGPDGKVAVLINGELIPKGSWRSQPLASEPKDNKIRYEINGQPQPPVPVKYRFNQQNQLEAIIPAAANGGADSEPFAFIGSIQIDDAHDIVYQLITSEGAPMQRNVTVYGDLRIDPQSHNLMIDLAGGGVAEIKGESGLASLEALKHDLTPFKANDLLRFKASTTNVLSNGQTKKIAADTKFVGNWDLKGNQLVFVSEVKGDITKPTIQLAFAGKFKAVAAGLAYSVDTEHGPQLAFTIEGQHQWNNGTAKWNVSLGYAKKQFTAKVTGNVAIKKQFDDHRDLTLSADWVIEHTDGSTTNLKMELAATYRWSDKNMLTLQAQVSKQGQTFSYDLKVEGKFVFKAGELTFQVRYSNQDPDNKFAFQIAFQGNQSNLIKALSVVLNVTENHVDITFQFEMRMTWVDGKLQKSEPQPIAA